MAPKPSLLIIGGGIVAVTIAREAAISRQFSSVTIAEKEARFGIHSSIRNSGVIHAGFYYDPDSAKARFCAEGNTLMRTYCMDNNLPLLKCGKVVVSSSEHEDNVLHELLNRGNANGSELYLHDKSRLSDYEPLATTFQNFLWSPNTWSASPYDVMQNLLSELKELSVSMLTNFKFIESDDHVAKFQNGQTIAYDFVINAAGGYALEVSKRLGFTSSFALLPFKGLYLKSKLPCKQFKVHIYPVPDIEQPFLGIHTTLTFDGFLKLGPTALPALSPENYGLFDGLDLIDTAQLLLLQASLFAKDSFGFRRLAFREFQYLIKNNIVNAAQRLTSVKLESSQFEWYSPGIRAQLYNTQAQKLHTDFLLASDRNRFHVLNAISPAWTCSFKTAKSVLSHVVQQI